MSSLFDWSDFSKFKDLSSDKSITISRPDKGRGVVILNRFDYLDKMNNILSDTSKFQKVNCDNVLLHTIHQEDKVNRVINKFKKLGCLPEATA